MIHLIRLDIYLKFVKKRKQSPFDIIFDINNKNIRNIRIKCEKIDDTVYIGYNRVTDAYH